MKKLKELFGKFIGKCKAEKNFRYAVIIVSLIVIAFAVNEWREWEDSKELPPTAINEEQTEEVGFLQEFWNDSKLHFFMFGGLTAALGIVKWRNSVRLKDSGKCIKK